MDVEPSLQQVLTQIRSDLDAFRGLLPLPAQLEELRHGMEELRHGMEEFRHEFEEFRHEIRDEMRGFETRVSVRLAKLEVKVETEMATKKDLAELRADGERMLATALDAQEKSRVAADKALSHPDILNDHGTRLRDHERRLRRLEGRKPS